MSITLHDNVTPQKPEAPPEDVVRYQVHSKTFRTELGILVDVDHSPSVYRLDQLLLKTADGGNIPLMATHSERSNRRFEFYGGLHNLEPLEICLMNQPDPER